MTRYRGQSPSDAEAEIREHCIAWENFSLLVIRASRDLRVIIIYDIRVEHQERRSCIGDGRAYNTFICVTSNGVPAEIELPKTTGAIDCGVGKGGSVGRSIDRAELIVAWHSSLEIGGKNVYL